MARFPARRQALAVLLAALLLAAATAAPGAPAADATYGGAFTPYLVRLPADNALVAVDPGRGVAALAPLVAAARQAELDELAGELARLQAAGLAGAFTYDETEGAFRAELAGGAAAALAAYATAPAPADPAPAAASSPSGALAPAGISSVIFAQVNSPLVWGNTGFGGLIVQLTLENGDGVVKGVPAAPASGTPCQALPNCVNVDPATLYFEASFVDPTYSQQSVPMRPGDTVHIVTSGDDPGTPGDDPAEDKRVPIVGLEACASPEQNSVQGATLPDAQVIVTFGPLALRSGYLTPGSGMKYAEVTADSGGHFAAAAFRTSTDPAYNVIDFVQGSLGFVRVRVPGSGGQPTGDEVWTIHGQNAYVLQDSPIMHGYAYMLPTAPGGLAAGVAAPRPSTSVNVTLKGPGGVPRASVSGLPNSPFTADFGSATISAWDTVEVAISYGGSVAFTNTVQVLPVTAEADLATSQVTGMGPANTPMVVSAGNVQGYVTRSSTFDAFKARVTSGSDGAYSSGQVLCGAGSYLALAPGSFGYAGYEAPCGNFVYTAYAAPANYVMAGFTYIDGWIDGGISWPTVAVSGPGGVKQAPVQVEPRLLWLANDKLYTNTYYNSAPSVFVEPGDTVTIVSGSRTHVIAVDDLSARLYAEQDLVAGRAPGGAALRAVIEKDRAARKEITAAADGSYVAANPYTVFSASTCALSQKTESLNPGDYGRVFLRHADGNEVFVTFYNRALHVMENANVVTLSAFALRAIDWPDMLPYGTRSVAVRFTPLPGQGNPGSGSAMLPISAAGATNPILLKRDDIPAMDAIIRAGGRLAATYEEGRVGLSRPVTLTMDPLPLIIGSPDRDTNTVAAVGPVGWPDPDGGILAGYGIIDWAGTATLKLPAATAPFAHSGTTAYAPVQFKQGGSVIPLVSGSTGTVSFVDPLGSEIYAAWGITDLAYQPAITPRPHDGETLVCGLVKPPAGLSAEVTVNIHDVTTQPDDIVIATGTSDVSGRFCVPVSPALVQGQVLLAEVNGFRGQPVVVWGPPLYLPLAAR